MSDDIIKATGVSKVFSRADQTPLVILQETDYAVCAGQVQVICGASGSGKTTLLNLLGGLDQPSEGELHWRGEAISGWSSQRLARERNRFVSFVFQQYHLLPELDAVENVLLPGWIRKAEDRSRAKDMLERVGLSDRVKHRPYELSGGEQQRVAVARALYQDPEVILADEPTGNLDSENSRRVVDLLLELAEEEKKALVLVTHDFTIAERVGSVTYLVDGTLSAQPESASTEE